MKIHELIEATYTDTIAQDTNTEGPGISKIEGATTNEIEEVLNKNLHIEYAKKIANECKLFLKLSKGLVLWRNRRENKILDKVEVYRDRTPTDTSPKAQKAFDQALIDLRHSTDNEKYAKVLRKYAMFAVGNFRPKNMYGYAYAVYPINNFYYTWHPFITDIREITKYFEHPDTYDLGIKQLKDMIYNKGFDEAIFSGNEITINCKYYYAIHYSIAPLVETELQRLGVRRKVPATQKILLPIKRKLLNTIRIPKMIMRQLIP